MQTISISTDADSNGKRLYRAAIGDQASTGKTLGEAIDALTVKIGSPAINGFLLLQSCQPDRFFSAEEQQQLAALMTTWRIARDRRESLPPAQQLELDELIEAELYATAERAQSILAQATQIQQQ
jgi:hypothetical protein